MPELPEVEVVRRGLDPYLRGRRISAITVHEPRSVRRHTPGAAHFIDILTGARLAWFSRRGKFLWAPLAGTDEALVIHLGMSGQALLTTEREAPQRHLRLDVRFEGRARTLSFVDQRMFGGMQVDGLVDDGTGGRIPTVVAHIARDPLDPLFDPAAVVQRMRRRHSAVKHQLLDQTLVSGIGNIYADEALWRARLHWRTPGSEVSPVRLRGLLGHAADVMRAALAQGGTSFDALYVNVNGESGYFARTLDAYGREGEPCHRCGRPLLREPFEGRSSFRCPKCQPAPRSPHP